MFSNFFNEENYDINKSILWIWVFLLLYLMLNISLIAIYAFFPWFLEYIFSFFAQFPWSINLFILVIIQEIILLTMLLIWIYVWKNYNIQKLLHFSWNFFKKQMKENNFSKILWYWVWFYILYIVISWFLYLFLNFFDLKIPWFFGEQDVATTIWWIWTDFWYDYLLLFLAVWIIGPLVEEIIYRWFITKQLIKKRGWIIWWVLWAAIFALIHFERQVMGNLFILALFLSYIYYKTWSLTYCFAFHFIVNTTALMALFFGDHIEEFEETYNLVIFFV